MTAIAYKDGILAVDSLLVEADAFKLCSIDKVKVVTTSEGVWLMAASGIVNEGQKAQDFLEDYITGIGEQDSRPITEEEFVAKISRDYDVEAHDYTIIVVRPSGGWTYFNSKGFEGHYPVDVPSTSGSAYQFLIGAIAAGADAPTAVHLAATKMTNCGPPVRVYKHGIGEIAWASPQK